MAQEDAEDDDYFRELRKKWRSEHQTLLYQLSIHNQGIERSILAKQREAKRREWDSRPETTRKKVERAARNTNAFISTFLIAFLLLTGVVGYTLALITAQCFNSRLAGFVLAAIVAIPAVSQIASRVFNDEHKH